MIASEREREREIRQMRRIKSRSIDRQHAYPPLGNGDRRGDRNATAGRALDAARANSLSFLSVFNRICSALVGVRMEVGMTLPDEGPAVSENNDNN